MKKIFFTVTNDLTYDQRMQRICTSLAENGYAVTLTGYTLRTSVPLKNEKYRQKRINCLFKKGKLFYSEYNTRLFFYLLFKKIDAICAIDLDTILPCLYISRWKRIPRVYDAHELFTGLKEVATRPANKKILDKSRKTNRSRIQIGYTVSESIAEEFDRRYGVKYEVIRNITKLRELKAANSSEKFLLYQGDVNEARGFEFLIPAMKDIDCRLVICGEGNFMDQLKQLIIDNAVDDKVELKGMLSPEDLWSFSQMATIGMAISRKHRNKPVSCFTQQIF